jgi:hypothetical protein
LRQPSISAFGISAALISPLFSLGVNFAVSAYRNGATFGAAGALADSTSRSAFSNRVRAGKFNFAPESAGE